MSEEQIKGMLNGIINNGEKWEYRWCTADGWSDWKEYKLGSGIYGYYEYRKVVEKEEPKYRPYKSTEEMIADFCDRFSIQRIKYVEPPIWVKGKVHGIKRLIIAYDSNSNKVLAAVTWYDLKALFSGFTYLDGSPCGIKE